MDTSSIYKELYKFIRLYASVKSESDKSGKKEESPEIDNSVSCSYKFNVDTKVGGKYSGKAPYEPYELNVSLKKLPKVESEAISLDEESFDQIHAKIDDLSKQIHSTFEDKAKRVQTVHQGRNLVHQALENEAIKNYLQKSNLKPEIVETTVNTILEGLINKK